MEAKIKQKQKIAEGTLEVSFEVLGEQPEFKPGQYFFVTLPKLHYPDTRGNKRHFSIVNSPNQKGVLTMATRLRDSGFKKTLGELALGEQVEVGPISGSFTLPEDTTRPLVFIAGGIGITPFISMLRYITEENLPYQVSLIYSNRDSSSTAFLKELESLAIKNPNIKLVLTMTQDEGWNGEKRRIDSNFIKDYTQNLNNPEFFVVGPPPMVESVKEALDLAGIGAENIKSENFSGY